MCLCGCEQGRHPADELRRKEEEVKAKLSRMKRVIIESPYAGKSNVDIEINEIYGRFCMRDCLTNHDEAPYASHLLYTQKFVLRDKVSYERKLGIGAGFLWRDVADRTVFYIDLGMTTGMKEGITDCEEKGNDFEVRHLPKELWDQFLTIMRSAYPDKFGKELAEQQREIAQA